MGPLAAVCAVGVVGGDHPGAPVFFRRHAPESARFAATVDAAIGRGDHQGAARALTGRRSLEARVLLAGLVACEQGADAVEELLAGALGAERAHFEARLSLLATLASNAPSVGLFNSARQPAFLQLDVCLDKQWVFDRWLLGGGRAAARP